MVSVFHFSDFRKFLSTWIAEQRQTVTTFSLRGFSKRAGFASHASLHLVINGKRELTDGMIQKVARALKLSAIEARFFADLVKFTQAETTLERQHHYQRMVQHAKFRAAHQPERNQLEYFSQWYYAAIREMISLPDFCENPHWIAQRLKSAITAEQAAEAIRVLIRLNLCWRDTQRKLRLVHENIATADKVASLAVAQYHEAMIHRAATAIKSDPLKEVHLTGLTVCLSSKTLKKVKERLHEFRRELCALLQEDDHPEEVYQINLQMIGLTRRVA